MYGHKKITSVDELQTRMFWARLRKNGKVPDLSSLPPCSSALKKHTSSAHYVAKMWKQAVVPLQSIDLFENCGWLADGSVDWIDTAYPEDLECLFAERNIDVQEDDDGEDDDSLEGDKEDVQEDSIEN